MDTASAAQPANACTLCVALAALAGASRESVTTVDVKPSGPNAGNVSMVGNTISTLAGRGELYNTLRVQAVAGNYTLVVSAPRTTLELAPVIINLQMRKCVCCTCSA